MRKHGKHVFSSAGLGRIGRDVGKSFSLVYLQQSRVNKPHLPQPDTQLLVTRGIHIGRRLVVNPLVVETCDGLCGVAGMDEANRRAAVAVVWGNHYDAVAGQRTADVRVGVPGATKAVREEHYWPAFGSCGGLENIGVGVHGYRGELEKLGEKSGLLSVLKSPSMSHWQTHEKADASALFAPKNRAYAAMYSRCGLGIHFTAFCSLSCLHG